MRADAGKAGGLRISRDLLDRGPRILTARRQTDHIIGGIEGELTAQLSNELVGHHGRSDSKATDSTWVSQAGIDVITTPTTDCFRLEQIVVTGLLSGDTGAVFNLPGGGLRFSPGAQDCKE